MILTLCTGTKLWMCDLLSHIQSQRAEMWLNWDPHGQNWLRCCQAEPIAISRCLQSLKYRQLAGNNIISVSAKVVSIWRPSSSDKSQNKQKKMLLCQFLTYVYCAWLTSTGQFTAKSKIHIFPLTCGAVYWSDCFACQVLQMLANKKNKNTRKTHQQCPFPPFNLIALQKDACIYSWRRGMCLLTVWDENGVQVYLSSHWSMSRCAPSFCTVTQ